MKKLSIILALIMALSCFSFAAFAAGDEESSAAAAATTTKKEMIDFYISVVYLAAHPDGSYHDHSGNIRGIVDEVTIRYRAEKGTKITPEFITNIVKQAATVKVKDDVEQPVLVLDETEYVLNPKVFLGDYNGSEVILQANGPSSLGSQPLGEDEGDNNYAYVCYAMEIDDVDNFAQVAASELGGYNWDGVAKANVTLINELIKGFRAAVDSVIKDTDSLGKTEKAAAVNGTTAARTSPKTGASAVAGVAVVVLALSATTAVVLRKKED